TQKFLPKYQLPAMHKARGETRHASSLKKRSKRIAEDLLSANARFSHGRLISAVEARDDVGLHIDLLARDDPLWAAYWELYLRAEVYMQTAAVGEARVSKIFFDRVDVAGVLSLS